MRPPISKASDVKQRRSVLRRAPIISQTSPPISEASDVEQRRSFLRRTTKRPTAAKATTAEARKMMPVEPMLTVPGDPFWLSGTVLRTCKAVLPCVVGDADGCSEGDTKVAMGDWDGNTVNFLGVGATTIDMEKLRLKATEGYRERSYVYPNMVSSKLYECKERITRCVRFAFTWSKKKQRRTSILTLGYLLERES